MNALKCVTLAATCMIRVFTLGVVAHKALTEIIIVVTREQRLENKNRSI